MSEKKEKQSESAQVEEVVQEKTNDMEIDKDTYIAKLNDDLVEQKKKAEEYFEHLKRNMADFDNFKKRIVKEKDNMYVALTGDILELLIPILDNFENAVMTECSDESYKNGIMMIYTQYKEVMKKMGLDEIEALGETFDPNMHEAVMHIEDENYSEKEIVEVLRKGYKFGDKVIRHSMVKVAN